MFSLFMFSTIFPGGQLTQFSPTVRYDTICCFNVRSKADISQLNLPHGTNNWKVENRKKLKSNKQICSEVSVNSSRGIREVSAEEEKEGCGGKN